MAKVQQDTNGLKPLQSPASASVIFNNGAVRIMQDQSDAIRIDALSSDRTQQFCWTVP